MTRRGQIPLLTRKDFAPGQYRRKPAGLERDLQDGDPFPFGAHRGRKMRDVPIHYYRWVLAQPWIGNQPAVQKYALAFLAAEHRQQADYAKMCGRKQAAQPTPKPCSDPAKARQALEDLRKFKETLL